MVGRIRRTHGKSEMPKPHNTSRIRLSKRDKEVNQAALRTLPKIDVSMKAIKLNISMGDRLMKRHAPTARRVLGAFGRTLAKPS